ncbi:MAG: hypothetical protein J3Q66DRAFT_406076 [Benniella sp.]|nr:MAG: hypothetical protein J3Q66DRAFT_406076 [Benniella sp.]
MESTSLNNGDTSTQADVETVARTGAVGNTSSSPGAPRDSSLNNKASSEAVSSSYSSWTVPSLDFFSARRASAFGMRYGLISSHASTLISGRTSPAPSGTSLMLEGSNSALLQSKARKLSIHLSESITGVLNDSSLVFYRMNEHIHKKVPQFVEEKKALASIRRNVEAANQDLEDARHTISGLQRITELGTIEELLKRSLAL